MPAISLMRAIQGRFSYINNATALMAGETPHRKSGWVMSQMMTASTAGNLIGPILGGALSSLVTCRAEPGATGFLLYTGLMAMVFWQHCCSFMKTSSQ